MELAILHVLWEDGPSTVQHVQERLPGDPAYTTVQTIMNTMEKKGRTARKLTGKAFVYRAAVNQDVAAGGAVRDLVDRVFKGSVEGLLMNLVKTDQVDRKTLKRLKLLVAEKKEQK
jgi:BlaI family transcriptional regulator, penicillinase repressor